MPLVGRRPSLRNGIKKLREEKRQVEVVISVEEAGSDGVDGLVGPTVIVSGRKHNR